MVFITHDLALAATISDKILVMYKGEAIEYGAAKDVLNNPQQPYTKALLACRPSAQQKGYRLPVVADYLDDLNGVVVPEKEPVIKVRTENILEVNNLRVWFPVERNLLGVTKQYFKAVDGVSFDIKKGEVLGLVGESGCGKSTVSRALMGLLPVHSGNILFEGKEVSQLTAQQWRQVRKDIQLIFQDPYASLNPRISIGDMLYEALRTHHIVPANAVRKEAERLMDLVQLPFSSLDRYPHQFSGGQRQRIGLKC
jgi:peptide/nickel transport system ATP-binding protein